MADAQAGTVQNENIDKFLYMAVVISLRTPPVAVQAAERGPEASHGPAVSAGLCTEGGRAAVTPWTLPRPHRLLLYTGNSGGQGQSSRRPTAKSRAGPSVAHVPASRQPCQKALHLR